MRFFFSSFSARSPLLTQCPGIPSEYFNLISNGFLPKGEADEQKVAEGRQKYDAALAEKILALGDDKPELIVLAGWMYVFSAAFLEPMKKAGISIINLHPALPGKRWRIFQTNSQRDKKNCLLTDLKRSI
jgi:phosphoribosylglycinamide formyltransferase